jgi:hypothetical protein
MQGSLDGKMVLAGPSRSFIGGSGETVSHILHPRKVAVYILRTQYFSAFYLARFVLPFHSNREKKTVQIGNV